MLFYRKKKTGLRIFYSCLIIWGSLLYTVQSYAQLSGTYTIDAAKQSSASNFKTMSAAVNYLISYGVSGPVTFLLANGNYADIVELHAFKGMGQSNTVTFASASGDNSSVVFASPYQALQWQFLSVSYISLKYITIEQDFAGNSAVNITQGDHISISGCRIISKSSTVPAILDQYSDGNNSFADNTITGGSVGIYCGGDNYPTGETFFRNTISSPSGIQVNQFDSVLISHNTITSSGNVKGYGIVINQCQGASQISYNKILVSSGQAGISLATVLCSKASPYVIFNNMVSVVSDGIHPVFGFSGDVLNNVNIIYNNINLSGTYQSSAAACSLSGLNIGSKVTLTNNIFANTAAGPAVVVQYLNSGTLKSDYNCFYSSGSTVYAYNTTGYTLSGWKSKFFTDSNSITCNPYFSSSSNLHCKNGLLYMAGKTVNNISDDFDGDKRNTTHPCIGADEFIRPLHNLFVINYLQPSLAPACGENTAITAIVTNIGGSTEYKVPLGVMSNDAETLEDTLPSLAPGQIDTITFSKTLSTTSGGNFAIKVFSRLSNDADRSDDTMYEKRFYIPVAQAPAVHDIYFCRPGFKTLTAAHAAGDSVQWLDADKKVIGNGDTLRYYCSTGSTLYVRSYRMNEFTDGDQYGYGNQGLFSAAKSKIILTAAVNLILDSITVYPKASGSFVIYKANTPDSSKRFTVKVTSAGKAVKLPVGIYLPKGQTDLFIDSISTPGLFATYHNVKQPLSQTMPVSVNPVTGDSLYRYLFAPRFSIISKCNSMLAPVNIYDGTVYPFLHASTGMTRGFKNGILSNPDSFCGNVGQYTLTTNFPNEEYGKTWSISSLQVSEYLTGNQLPAAWSHETAAGPISINIGSTKENNNKLLIMKMVVSSLKGGCDTTIQRWLSLYVPKVQFTMPLKICSEGTLFSVYVPQGELYNYTWYFGDGTKGQGEMTDHDYKMGTDSILNFMVKLNASAGLAACPANDSEIVTVFTKTKPSFTYSINSRNVASFHGTNTFPADLNWDYGDFQTDTGSSVQHYFQKQGVYLVKLTASLSGECANSITRAVLIDPALDITAATPQVFTYGVYPNPSTDHFIAKIALHESACISLEMNTIDGRKICSLIQDKQLMAGETLENIPWPKELPDGCYLLNLRVNNSVKTIKVIKGR